MKRPWNLTRPRRPRREVCLTFAPLAWLKLAYFCHLGETEIGGFGLSAPDRLLYVQDFVTVRQEVTAVTVRFLDEAVADHFDRCLDNGLAPQRSGRLWIHTHPGDSPLPSSTDEETFDRGFGPCDWAVMMILAHSGQSFARLALNTGPGAELEIPVRVDWSAWPESLVGKASLVDHASQWREEYQANIHPRCPTLSPVSGPVQSDRLAESWWAENLWAIGQEEFDPKIFEEDLLDGSHECPHAG
jgi:hypothetical protein